MGALSLTAAARPGTTAFVRTIICIGGLRQAVELVRLLARCPKLKSSTAMLRINGGSETI
jgi:hypothetical protein